MLNPQRRSVYKWDVLRPTKEKHTKDPGYYAREVGLDITDDIAETDDGYLLRMHTIVNIQQQRLPDGRGLAPVLLVPGLFQCSGCFITSEERSLAFWLSNQGYQVFMGNNRGVFGMGHREFSRSDPRFWDWTIEELATHDLPAMIDYVCHATGYEKITLVAHSQGAGAAFIALSQGMRPDIGEKLSGFIAMSPAVYAGPHITSWLFATLGKFEWGTWARFFGVRDFIPLMGWAYESVPFPVLFGKIGYAMFLYLFGWTDANWLLRRKTKNFRFTPTPVSSASLFWWCGKDGWAQRGCSLDTTLPKWFDSRCPPLSIYWGGKDTLIDTDALVGRLKTEPAVTIIRTVRLEEAEHCDFYYAADAVEWCFSSFVEDIEKTRLRYPHEAASLISL
ncbi:hypothetical protein FRB94_006328 [Tulasnella sp. JGI-2019a]|nr:hypothetical protein FRB94_006328 [Tulasnella sp. JGI-2019a]